VADTYGGYDGAIADMVVGIIDEIFGDDRERVGINADREDLNKMSASA
jgi:hypothetical protein